MQDRPRLAYLSGDARAAFDRWLEAAVARCVPPLTFAELRKGVQALSALWVERRGGGALGERALDGRAKRAAFATYYTGLHFLTAWHALAELGPSFAAGLSHLHDLGCGAGALGAAAGVAAGRGPQVLAVDRSGFALGEARRTYAAFGLRARTRRGGLPEAFPARADARDLMLLGWTVNELAPSARDALLDALAAAAARGARLLVLEPLAGPMSPWWEAWVARLAPLGAEARLVKRAVELPSWIAQLDRAAGLDHAVLGARVLARGPAGA
jgi:SAM-dependent methyltransferase